MFGTVIEKLQDLLPKRFLLASFMPVLLFCLLNGALLYVHDGSFRAFADRHLLAGSGSEDPLRNGVLLFFAVLVASYLFSLLNTRLRELLEGAHWPGWLARSFTRAQRSALQEIVNRYDRAQWESSEIRAWREPWTRKLAEARRHGPGKPETSRYDAERPAARQIAALRELRDTGQIISLEALRDAVAGLGDELWISQMDPPGRDGAALLDAHQQELPEIVAYAEARYSAEVNALFNQRQFNFPAQLVAPTAMGNIARSIQSYTLSRYALNIDVLWTRFQKVMHDDGFYGVLQDAKTQVDFLVSCIWLVAVTGVVWLVVPICAGYGAWLFLATAAGIPVALLVLHRLALQNYRAFADLMRSAVDVYRFALLQQLHIALPPDALHERELWRTLGHQLGYGEAVPVPYDHGG